MAYQTILTQDIYNWEQEQVTETNLVADPETGIVTEVTTLIQDYARVRGEIEVQQEILSEGTSRFKAELRIHLTAGEMGEGFGFYVDKGINGYQINRNYTYLALQKAYSSYIWLIGEYQPSYPASFTIKPGETKTIVLNRFLSHVDGRSDYLRSTSSGGYNLSPGYHDFDGYFDGFQHTDYFGNPGKVGLTLTGRLKFSLSNLLTEGSIQSQSFSQTFTQDAKPYALSISRAVIPTTANNFTDEENPSFTYAATSGKIGVTYLSDNNYYYIRDEIIGLQAALSFDGEAPDVVYRDIPIDSTSYTFNLTDAERETIRIKAQGSDNVPIYYLTKITRRIGVVNNSGKVEVEEQTKEFTNATQRILTIVGCNPQMNPTVKDIKEETLALTGDENTFIRYESMAEYAINAVASKHATIVNQSVQCGSKIIEGLPYGVIQDVEDGTFIFYALDSRGLAVSGSVFKNLVEYVKPTCYQKLEIEITGETGATIKLKTNGNYFDGSFGAVNNTLTLQVRYTDGNNNMGDWITLTGTPTFNGNTYELNTTLTGFDYGKAYIFQCRAIDKLNVVESAQYTVRMLPVFDWSETDFNFNVPINIEADTIGMNGETIIRHNPTANNTVLSATGGHIYIRPGGTDNTSGETIFYPNGDVSFNGTVNLGNSFTLNGNKLADYIIESGSSSMGSNGTWYWAKWASGKAECWGCRNFGNMAVTTAWGNLYRSAILTQDLPEDVFVTTPDVININIVNGNFGGWICKHENLAPSAVTTGSFIWVRPASATVSPTYIGFHVIGLWTQ